MLLNTHRKRPEFPETETVSNAANVSRNSTVMLWTKVSSLTYIPRQTLLLTAGKVEGLAALAEKRRVNKERDADKVSAIINVVHVCQIVNMQHRTMPTTNPLTKPGAINHPPTSLPKTVRLIDAKRN